MDIAKHLYLDTFQLIHPRVLAVNYPGYSDNEEDTAIASFSPDLEHIARLRHVFMYITLPDSQPDALFDFRNLRDASIKAEFDHGVGYYLAIPVNLSISHSMVMLMTLL